MGEGLISELKNLMAILPISLPMALWMSGDGAVVSWCLLSLTVVQLSIKHTGWCVITFCLSFGSTFSSM